MKINVIIGQDRKINMPMNINVSMNKTNQINKFENTSINRNRK